MRALILPLLLLTAIGRTQAGPGLDSLQRLVHRTAAERMVLLNDYYGTGMDALDSATIFQQIAKVRELASGADDPDLMREAEVMRAHYYWHFQSHFTQERVLGVLDSLAERGEREGCVWLRIRAENMLAFQYFTYLGRYEEGFEHFTRMADLMRGLTAAELPLKGEGLHQVGMAHYKFRDYQKAADYFREAIATGSAPGYPFYITRELNDVGMCFRQLGALDSSDHYFRRALASAQKQNAHDWIGIATGNLGHNLYLRGKFDEALPLLEVDLANARAIHDDGLAAGSLITLGDIALQQGEPDRARTLLDEARLLVRRSGQVDRLSRLYPLLAKLSAEAGNGRTAGAYIDSAAHVRDSLDRAFDALKLTRIEQKMQAERSKAEEEELRLRSEGQVTRRNGIIIALFLGMVIALILFNRYRHTARLKQQAAAERQRHAEAELRSAADRLDAFMRSFQEKSQLLDEATEEVARLKETAPVPVPDNPDRDFHLKLLQKSVLLTDNDWVEFSALFERVHAGFFARLAEKMPGLTPAETRFMALSRLGMNGKEMAAMLGVGAEAIRQVRHRVRRKAEMGEEVTMEQVAAAI